MKEKKDVGGVKKEEKRGYRKRGKDAADTATDIFGRGNLYREKRPEGFYEKKGIRVAGVLTEEVSGKAQAMITTGLRAKD